MRKVRDRCRISPKGANNKRSSDGTYGKEGNLILRVTLSDSSRTEYTWDLRNRLTNITERATLGGAATKSIDYVYDVFDRRISKSFDADGAGAGAAVVTQFVYDGSSDAQVILQFGGSNNLTHRDLWAENIDQVLADENSSNAILWSLNDNLGTVRDLIDNTGTVQNHLKYGAFHNVTSETNSAIDFLMGAAGMVRDEETGASYAWHRYTQNGRWWSEDPIDFKGKDPNLQRVMGNGPIDSVDPSGLAEWLANTWNNIAVPTLQGIAMAPVEALKYGNVFGQAYMLYNKEHPAQVWYQQIENHGFIAGTANHSGNTLYTLAEATTPFQVTVGSYIRYKGVFPDSQQDVENAKGQQYRHGVAVGTTLLSVGAAQSVEVLTNPRLGVQVVKPSAGPSSTIELDIGPKPVTLYHFGDLSNGVSGTQRLSTSPVSDLSHYRSGGKLYEFAVPADVYNNWLLDNTIQRFNDLHAPTGIITPEVRIMPPATAEMNNYLLPREPR